MTYHMYDFLPRHRAERNIDPSKYGGALHTSSLVGRVELWRKLGLVSI